MRPHMKQLTRRYLQLMLWGFGATAVAAACSSDDSEYSGDSQATSGRTASPTQSSNTATSANTTGPTQGPSHTGPRGGDTNGASTTTGTTGTATSGGGGTTGTGGSTTGTGGDAGSMSTQGGTNASTTGGRDPVPSEGCTAVSPPSGGNYSIDVDGTEREYILKLPADYDPSRPYPLILAWHEAQYSAEWVDTGGEPQTGPYFG